MRRAAAFARDRSGAAALEFALVGLPLILLILGLVEFGRALYVRAALDAAADRAQRVLLIAPDTSDNDLGAFVREELDGLSSDRLTIDHGAETISGARYRLLELRYDMVLAVPTPLGSSLAIDTVRRIFVVR